MWPATADGVIEECTMCQSKLSHPIPTHTAHSTDSMYTVAHALDAQTENYVKSSAARAIFEHGKYKINRHGRLPPSPDD